MTTTQDNDMEYLATADARINAAAADLAADNAAAKLEADRRDWEALHRLIKRFGLCNVIGECANAAADIAEYADHDAPYDVDGKQSKADYELAAQILDAAAQAVDLTYGHNPLLFKKRRENAADVIQILARQIEP